MTLSRSQQQASLIATLAIVSLLALAGCGSSSDSATTSEPPPTVTVALDWTPNTNHIGVYVAQQLGYYKDAKINVKLLPYADTPPETLVARGRADFGFGYQAGVAYARASGLDVLQVFASIAKPQYAIGVNDGDKSIKSPKDLDGKIYAGFGTPDEGPALKYVIRKDGGSGNFRTITLNTAAYEAVYSKKADFTIPATTWEGVQAKLLGKPLRYFQFSDYGFPIQYSSLIESSGAYLKSNGGTARRFLSATQRGYEYANSHPLQAAEILLKANPQTLKDPQLVRESAKLLAAGRYYQGASDAIGPVDESVWNNYGNFLYDSKLLTGKDGKPLTARPNWSTFFTNDYLGN